MTYWYCHKQNRINQDNGTEYVSLLLCIKVTDLHYNFVSMDLNLLFATTNSSILPNLGQYQYDVLSKMTRRCKRALTCPGLWIFVNFKKRRYPVIRRALVSLWVISKVNVFFRVLRLFFGLDTLFRKQQQRKIFSVFSSVFASWRLTPMDLLLSLRLALAR
jgi:hypothetical protein